MQAAGSAGSSPAGECRSMRRLCTRISKRSNVLVPLPARSWGDQGALQGGEQAQVRRPARARACPGASAGTSPRVAPQTPQIPAPAAPHAGPGEQQVLHSGTIQLPAASTASTCASPAAAPPCQAPPPAHPLTAGRAPRGVHQVSGGHAHGALHLEPLLLGALHQRGAHCSRGREGGARGGDGTGWRWPPRRRRLCGLRVRERCQRQAG